MAACISSPTATQTNVRTFDEPSTSFSLTTRTIPESTSTWVTTSCSSVSNSTCIGSTVSTSTTTFPEVTTTISEPIVTRVPVTTTELVTLWGSTCSRPPDDVPSSSSIFTSTSASTLPNGSITIQTVTSTIIPDATPGGQQDDNAGKSSTPSNLGAIIGGTVGGVFGIIGIVLIIWFVLKRRKRWDDIFDHDDMDRPTDPGRERFSLSADIEPKPYQYGLVGHVPQPPQNSPPNSPPMAMNPLDSDPMATAYGGINSGPDPYGHHRTPSVLAPLNVQHGVPMSTGPTPTSVSMSISRPSTANSMQPLNRPPPGAAAAFGNMQPQQYPPSHSRATSSYTTHSNSFSISSPPMQPMQGWAGGSEDPYYNRAGSPISVQENRRLQVANQSNVPGSPGWETEDDTRSSVAGPLSSLDMGSASDSFSRDGKGRLVLRNPGEVVVHQDGGRAQDNAPAQANQANQPAASGSAAPPAYSE